MRKRNGNQRYSRRRRRSAGKSVTHGEFLTDGKPGWSQHTCSAVVKLSQTSPATITASSWYAVSDKLSHLPATAAAQRVLRDA